MKTVRRRHVLEVASIALAFYASGVMSSVCAVAGTGPKSNLDVLAAYEGTWTGKLTYYATPESTAHVEALVLRNECWRSTDYYVCHQFVGGASAALLVYTYDAARDVFHSHVVPKDGSAAGGGELLIAGTTWTFPWNDRERGKTVSYRVVNVFTDRDTIAFRQEFSTDGRRWTRMADGEEKRVARRAVQKNRPA